MPTVLKNTLLILVSIALCTVAAEGMVRWIDAPEAPSDALKHLGEIPLAEGVQRAWFSENHRRSPNRKPVTQSGGRSGAEAEAADDEACIGGKRRDGGHTPVRHVQGVEQRLRRPRSLQALHYLKDAPGQFYVQLRRMATAGRAFASCPDTSDADRVGDKQYGFRGPPVPVARQPKTIRIAFIGA